MAACALSTPASRVHPLGRSSGPGIAPLDLESVIEPPAAFAPSGDPVHHPDAEVIELAERVEGLSRRIVACTAGIDRLQAAIDVEAPTPARHAPSEVWDAFLLIRRAAEDRAGLTRTCRLRGRMIHRLSRWAQRLTAVEPATQAGIAAKSRAFLALQADGREWIAGPMGTAVGRDALRIATALCDIEADADLLRLAAEWRGSAARVDAAGEAVEAALNRLARPTIPPALLFHEKTDASYLGSFLNFSAKPMAYTDPGKVAKLRTMAVPTLRARADEIVAAHTAWQTACKIAEEVSGYTSATSTYRDACAENGALRSRILATPAGTREGLRAKAEVALWCYGGEKALQESLAEDAADGRAGDEAMAWSMLLDFVRATTAGVLSNGLGLDAGPSDDSTLVATVAEFHRVDDLQLDLCARYHMNCEDIPGYAETEVPWRSSLDRTADLPARTWAGIVAKAAVLKSPTVHADLHASDSIGDSLAEDILRLAGRTWDSRTSHEQRSAVRAEVA